MSYNKKPSRARAHAPARPRLNVLIACEESQAECAASLRSRKLLQNNGLIISSMNYELQ